MSESVEPAGRGSHPAPTAVVPSSVPTVPAVTVRGSSTDAASGQGFPSLPWRAWWFAGLLLALSVVAGATGVGQPASSDLAQLVAAVAAGVACWRTSAQTSGRMRSSWAAAALGCAGWAAGEVAYSTVEIVSGEPGPGPATADLGFILFPIGAIAALLFFPPSGSRRALARSLLDGCALLAALLAVAKPAIDANIRGHFPHPTMLELVKIYSYPALDVMVIALVFYRVSRPTRHRAPLLLLATGIALIAIADAVFVSDSGWPADLGFTAGFLFLAYAGTTAGRLLASDRATGASPPPSQTPGATMLPYLPLAVAIVVTTVRTMSNETLSPLEPSVIAVAIAAVLLRQYLTVQENRALLLEVAKREDLLRRQAFEDQLTGLANRALFTDRVAHALHLHRRDLRPLGLLFCDLDDFKAVNDTMGHAAGDQLLVRVAERLRGALREGDTLARFGGDEFAVLLEDGSEPTSVATRIIDALRAPFTINGVVLNVGISVGVTDLDGTQPIPTLDGLLAHADVAMYSAKHAGKGQLALYDTSMVLPAATDLKLREPLRTALRAGNIVAVYQPIINLSDGSLTAVETLARWMHDGLQVSPVEFVPMAGRAGLLADLTDLMLERACAQLAKWSRTYGERRLQVGVNIPPQLIVDLDFPNRVAALVAKHAIRPQQLVLEITEDALLSDLATARTVSARLRRIGMSLSLDDFGTGYSSLLHLQQIPLDALKIDISFVANIDREPSAERFLQAFLALGRDLGLSVTAEGVEREEQAATLRRLGCPSAQGFLFSRPTTAAEVESNFLVPGAGWRPAPSRARRGDPARP
jgi:diguanylate cyclase (GGDEF)-like protein